MHPLKVLLEHCLIGLRIIWLSKEIELYLTYYLLLVESSQGFPGGSDDRESTCNAVDPGSIPGSRRPVGEGNGYPFQNSCLENSMDRGGWWARVHGVTESFGHD